MSRATSVDSTWVGELDANVSIGGTSATLASVVGTNWPSGAGIFGIQIGEDPDTDAELVQVTRSGAVLTNDASTPTFTKAHTAGASIYYLTTAADINAKPDDSLVLHTTGAESKAGILSLTDQLKALGGYSSLGQNYPDIIFDAADLKTGIMGTTGGIDFFIWDGAAQYAIMSVTASYVSLNAPLIVTPPQQLTSVFHDGSTVSNPYVPVATTDPGHIACYPTTAGAQLDITLPDPYNNVDKIYVVSDNEDGCATNNIVVTCDDAFALGTTVNGAASYTINTNGRVVMFKAQFNADYSNADWKIISIK